MPVNNPTQVNWGSPGPIGSDAPKAVTASNSLAVQQAGNFDIPTIALRAQNNELGGGGSQAEIYFFDRTAVSGTVRAASGNGAGFRQLQLLAGSDRDGNRMPIVLYTQDGSGYVQAGMTIAAGGTEGFAPLTIIHGPLFVGGGATFAAPLKLASYTVATVPSVSANSGAIVYVSNESGGATPAFSDGTNWRRVHDRAIIS